MHFDKNWSFLNKEEFKKIQWSFEVKNWKKEQARRMNMWNWQKLPDNIKHWEETKWFISIPAWLRGFWNFKDLYWEVDIINLPNINNPYKWNELDLKQDDVILKLLQKDVWYLHCSTGLGKTMITAKIIKQKSVKTLIVVSWIELMNQMQKDLEEIFWEKYPTIDWKTWILKQILIPDLVLEWQIKKWEEMIKIEENENRKKRLNKRLIVLRSQRKYKEEINRKKLDKILLSPIVIANIDTLVTLPKKEFFNKFDLTIMDEVDTYLWADRRREMIWKKISSKYLYWLTGTIKVNYTSDKVFDIYFWPKQELLEKHHSPEIYKVMTDFVYDELEDMKEFHLLKKELYNDNARNNLIVETVVETLWDNKWILFSEYVEHAKYLVSQLEQRWIKCFMLIWEVTEKERIEIKNELREYKWRCLLIWSVKIIWRWFNIPDLSIGYLTTAESFQSNTEQYIGRIIRNYPWKTKCEWYDFIDPWCRMLYNQSKKRNTTYKKEFPQSKIQFYN